MRLTGKTVAAARASGGLDLQQQSSILLLMTYLRLVSSMAGRLTALGLLQRVALLSAVAGVLVAAPSCSWRQKDTGQEPQNGQGVSVVLRWTAPNQPGIAGYRVYRGAASGKYGAPLDVGLLANSTLGGVVYCLYPNMPRGRSYVAVTTYNAARVESAYSNEKVLNITSASPPRADAGADQTGTVGAVVALGAAPDAGVSYFWQETAGPRVKLSHATTSRMQFRASQAGAYQFAVTAYDAQGVAARATVNVVVKSP